ncbi:MAG: T9SS type A sorting domain-containing protein [Bacteroidia bacterium]
MKNSYIKILTFLTIVFSNVQLLKAVQLSGTYTINPGAAATTTNFQNFTSAVTYMTSTNSRTDGGPANTGTVGVNGPVTFLVSAATYTEQVTIPAITGSSVTNTITFIGANKTTTVLQFNSTNTSVRHTLLLNLATNVTFRDMTIRSTSSTVGWVVHIMGLNSNNNRFINCNIDFTNPTAISSTSTNFIGVVINNSATSFSTGTRIDGTVIDSCFIFAGAYNIVAFGSSGNLHVGLRITNNILRHGNSMGIYCSFINGITLSNNYIRPRTSNLYNYGVYLINSTCTSPNRHIITNNRIFDIGYYGIYMSGSNNLSGNKGFIFNNIIGGGFKYEYSNSIYMSSSSQWAISHNTFYHDFVGQSNTNGAVFISGGSGISFRNNICAEKLASPALPLYASASSVFDTINHNLFFRPDTSNNVLVFIGSNLNSGNFRGFAGQNANSIYGNPDIKNDTIANMSNPCFQGTFIPYITTDYYGSTRSTSTPSIGAYEVPSLTNNLAVLRVLQPTPPISSGPTDLRVLVRNNGSNTVTSFNLSYRLNSGTPVTANWFGTLGACDTVSVTFTGSQQPNLGASNNFVIYSSSPNFTTDSDPSNDTIRISYFLPLSGTFQIGGSSPDFAKPSDAFNAIKSGGLAGPVTLIVNPGTYIDQVTFDEPVTGLSATNSITLQGTNKNTCIVQNNSLSGSSRYIFRIGQSYVTIRDLTIRSGSPDYGWGVHINKNNVKSVAIKNCIIENTHPNAINSTTEAYIGVVMSGSNNSLYYYDTYVLDSIEIDSNMIRNVYTGIWQYSYFYSYYYTYGAPSEVFKIRNNEMNNCYYSGVFMQGFRGIEVNYNVIRMRPSTASVYNYALYLYSGDANSATKPMNIIGNRILNSNYMGIYLGNVKAHTSNRGLLMNNVANINGDLANPNVLYLSSCNNFDIYNNTFICSTPSTSTTVGVGTFYSNTNLRMRNNHFVNNNPNGRISPVYMSGNSFTAPAMFNYNNYYRADTTGQFVFINTWYQGTQFRGVSGSNNNSIIVNPPFISDTLPNLTDGCINGDTISVLTTDITGNPRATRPDIGAYEVAFVGNDIGATQLLAPAPPVMSGLQDVTIRFRNFGSNPITSAMIGYRLNNNAAVSAAWIGNLQTCDTSSLTLTGSNQVNIPQGSINTLRAFTASPNFGTDSNTVNDTLIRIIATPMRGVYVIGSAPSDFTTINAAVNALSIRGVDSAVVFRIKTGNYNEQVTFNNIFGASAQNTITFTSMANHVDSVIISRNNTSASENFIIMLSNASFINFTRVTLQSLNSSFGYVVQLVGAASNNRFYECKLTAVNTTSTSTNLSIVYASPLTGGSNNFTKNIITGGSMAFYLFGTSETILTDNNVIDSNIITNQYTYGAYFYYTSNTKFRFNDVNTNVTYTAYRGIYGFYNDSAFEITNNRIFTTTATGYGIQVYYSDGFGNKTGKIVNNVIRIGTGASNTNYGIADYYSSNMLIAHNTVFVSSTSTASFGGYFYYTSTISNTTVIRNNIFVNLSTGRSIYYYNTSISSSDYNLYFTSGTVLGQRGTPAATYNTLADIKAALPATYDRNSIQYRTGTVSTTNLMPNLADTATWAINGRAIHIQGAEFDYSGNPRPTTPFAGTPDIGAYEITPTSLPPLCTPVPLVPAAGITQSFLFGGDTVVKVVYDQFFTPPTSLAVRQYSGVRPPAVDTTAGYLNMYLNMIAPPGFYNYTINLAYKPIWLGTVSGQANLRLAMRQGSFWTPYIGSGSTVDTLQRYINAPFLNSFEIVTGTDNLNPLPVTLINFSGLKSGEKGAILNWATSSEINSSVFEVERSFDNRNFTSVGSVKAAGNSRTIKNYVFEDRNAFERNNIVYYRLRMVDRDASFTYSKVISINSDLDRLDITLAPNPFKDNFVLNNVRENDAIEIMDMNGKVLHTENAKLTGTVEIKLPSNLKSGMYLIKISGTQTSIIKAIKE